MPPGALIKALPVIVEGRGPVLVLVRGDHRLNEIKLQNALGAPVPAGRGGGGARAVRRRARLHRPGRQRRWRCSPTRRCAACSGLVTGANEPDVHLRGVEPGRDFEPDWVDVRRVEAGDRCPAGRPIRIEPAIEVGNIFKLGTRYSEPLGARYLDEQGKEQLDLDGLLRDRAGAHRGGRDRAVRTTSRASPGRARVAPFDVELVTLGKEGEEARTVADRLYDELRDRGPRRALRRPRRAARARSSPTPSCSAARCG